MDEAQNFSMMSKAHRLQSDVSSLTNTDVLA